ncbi:hypothetical protein GEV33_001660 [Tenebrio molitor]|uniref:Uncharacterized protein n=1 Tax=Tenebrio molitor TaxID=7067 RepID=A0A8J6HSS8_TENMO|nr:hypothetical protein GEV33_001660 [Tenebrio molitor]
MLVIPPDELCRLCAVLLLARWLRAAVDSRLWRWGSSVQRGFRVLSAGRNTGSGADSVDAVEDSDSDPKSDHPIGAEPTTSTASTQSGPFAPLVSEPGHPLFPARSLPYERIRSSRSSLVSGPFAPLVSEPGLPPTPPPRSRHTPATPSHPDRFSRYAAKRKFQGRPTFCDDCLFVSPLPRALTADPWTPSLRRATPAVWRPTTAEKGTGARGIPRPAGVKSHPVTSPPEGLNLVPAQSYLWISGSLGDPGFKQVISAQSSPARYQIS